MTSRREKRLRFGNPYYISPVKGVPKLFSKAKRYSLRRPIPAVRV